MSGNKFLPALVTGAALLFGGMAAAMDDNELAQILDRRIHGDASGACLAAAVIEGGHVARAWRCADPADEPRIGPDVAFEIGSVTKTMAAILLADRIVSGEASLDDPVAEHLPPGTAVPDFQGQPIRLRHLVAHTSGLPRLPSRLRITDAADPYAGLGADDLLASLQDVTLAQAPGEVFEYSNFGTMLLSLMLSRAAGMDFEQLVTTKLFQPLAMDQAYVARRPDGVRAATGRLATGEETAAWTLAPELAGVGGVRATLDDMVRYVQAQFGGAPEPLAAAIALAQQPVDSAAEQPMAMNWLLMPLADRQVHGHDGGTGGFSAFVAFDLAAGRGVVVLADAGLAASGGVNDIGAHLLARSQPLAQPRRPLPRPAVAPTLTADQMQAYVGTWSLMPGLDLVLRERDGVLHGQATGQGEFALAPQAQDVFEAAAFGIQIRFSRDESGQVTQLELHQGGQVMPAQRRVE